MNETITFLIGLILGYGIASILLGRKRFLVKTNERGETTIEPLNRPKQKVEFISEPTQEDVDEAERPAGMRKFLKGIVKPPKEENAEEEL